MTPADFCIYRLRFTLSRLRFDSLTSRSVSGVSNCNFVLVKVKEVNWLPSNITICIYIWQVVDHHSLSFESTETVDVCWRMYADVCMLTYVCRRMMTYDVVCWRMLTYADVWWRMLTYADVYWRILTYTDVYWRMLTYADVCWRMLTYATVWCRGDDGGGVWERVGRVRRGVEVSGTTVYGPATAHLALVRIRTHTYAYHTYAHAYTRGVGVPGTTACGATACPTYTQLGPGTHTYAYTYTVTWSQSDHTVQVLVGRSLSALDRRPNGLVNPYVVLHIGTCASNKFKFKTQCKTKAIYKRPNPEWNQTFKLDRRISSEKTFCSISLFSVKDSQKKNCSLLQFSCVSSTVSCVLK